jgi:hypothetical protein
MDGLMIELFCCGCLGCSGSPVEMRRNGACAGLMFNGK